MSERAHDEIARLRAELDAEKKAHRETREVLEDLAHEKGLPQWLAGLAGEREALVEALDRSRTRDNDAGCFVCCGDGDHAATCEAQRLLRLLDPKETERQVDEAHEEALLEHARRARPPWDSGLLRGTEVTFRGARIHGLSFPTREPLEAMARRFSDNDQVDAMAYALDVLVAPRPQTLANQLLRAEMERREAPYRAAFARAGAPNERPVLVESIIGDYGERRISCTYADGTVVSLTEADLRALELPVRREGDAEADSSPDE